MSNLDRIAHDVRTITFDCYGTLIDWETGLRRALVELFGEPAKTRESQLFDAYLRAEMQVEAEPYRPYREVLSIAAQRAAEELGFSAPAQAAQRMAELLPRWQPFPDTNEALKLLKRRFRLGVLSNIDRDLFFNTAPQFGVEFDFVVTAQDVRSYKPAPGHFTRLLEAHKRSEAVLHVAQSLLHDGEASRQHGLRFVWINRRGEKLHGRAMPLATFDDLISFARAMMVDESS